MTRFILTAAAALAFSLPAMAQTATQAVTVIVPEVEAISVSAAALTMTFATPTAGGGFANVSNASSTYDLTVNTAGNKITGVLDGAYNTGISLAVALGAPAGGTSAGSVGLSTTAADLVTGVANVNATGLGITYIASATAAALPNGTGETQTVTYTITDQ